MTEVASVVEVIQNQTIEERGVCCISSDRLSKPLTYNNTNKRQPRKVVITNSSDCRKLALNTEAPDE